MLFQSSFTRFYTSDAANTTLDKSFRAPILRVRMSFPRQILLQLCTGLWLAASAPSALASWLVYELKFKPLEDVSLNYSFYTGAYIVTPLAGGPASIILTTEQDGRFYAVSQESARFFTAANPAARKAVLSALAINGSAQAFYTASGPINQTLSLPGPKGLRSYRVAAKLKGLLVASDDDSEAAALPTDGSVGMVGSSEITGHLRDDLTQNANQFASQTDIVLYLVGLLERYGYQPDTPPAESSIEGGTLPLIVDPEAASAALFPPGSGVDPEAVPDPAPAASPSPVASSSPSPANPE